MSDKAEPPFDSIEGSHEYVAMLAEALDEARRDVEAEIAAAEHEGASRRKEALLLVSYNLAKLNLHITSSRRIVMAGTHAAIVWIDCDLYVSTKPVLDFLSSHLTEGTVVCFDDYYCYRGSPEQGEQRALREFLADNPDVYFTPYLDFAPIGKSFLVHLTGARQDASCQ